MPNKTHYKAAAIAVLLTAWIAIGFACSTRPEEGPGDPALNAQKSRQPFEDKIAKKANAMSAEGQHTFRYDTFGDEDFWGGQLRLHDAVRGAKLGGVGAGVSPNLALKLGLKVDSEAVPKALADVIKKGGAPLDDPASTVALLKANAVVGLTGFFSADGKTLTSLGIQCALCHSAVDDSFAPGIGKRLDGWPNRDLDIGKIVSTAPNLKPLTDMLQVDEATVKKVLTSWGPGKFDALLNLDGKAFRPDGKSAATLNPAASALRA